MHVQDFCAIFLNHSRDKGFMALLSKRIQECACYLKSSVKLTHCLRQLLLSGVYSCFFLHYFSEFYSLIIITLHQLYRLLVVYNIVSHYMARVLVKDTRVAYSNPVSTNNFYLLR